MTQDFQVNIIRSARRTISMHIESDGSLLVKAPIFMTRWEINRFINKHTAWIEKKRAILREHVPAKRKFITGDEFLYLGKKYTLTIGDYKNISATDGKLLFPIALEFRIQKEIQTWYVRQAKEIITKQVEDYAKLMNTEFVNISFSDTSSKWGSCTPDNRLQFNWRLIMSSILVINYVVVHELAHTIHKNHSPAFWSMVGRFNPSYRTQRNFLKSHGHVLMID